MPRNTRLMAAFFVALAALPAGATVTHTEDLDAFGKKAAAALDSVGRFDDKVALDWWRPPKKGGFAFYGKAAGGGFESVECEETQEFHIIANFNDQAQFNIGVCKRDAMRVRDLAILAETALAATKQDIFKGATVTDQAAFDRMLAYRKVNLSGGMTGYAFTLLVIGHGIILVNSAVVLDASRQMAVIVQGNVTQLCGHSSPGGKPSVPTAFCPDTNKALLDVAADLAKRYK